MAKKKQEPKQDAHPDAAEAHEVKLILAEVGVKLEGNQDPKDSSSSLTDASVEDSELESISEQANDSATAGLEADTLLKLNSVMGLLKAAAEQAIRDHKRIPASHALRAIEGVKDFIKSCDQAGYNPLA